MTPEAIGDHAPALALHCSLGSSAQWRSLARGMPEREVIALDLLGYGDAPHPTNADDFSLDDEVDAVEQALRDRVDGDAPLPRGRPFLRRCSRMALRAAPSDAGQEHRAVRAHNDMARARRRRRAAVPRPGEALQQRSGHRHDDAGCPTLRQLLERAGRFLGAPASRSKRPSPGR